jgi:hypothetical protein
MSNIDFSKVESAHAQIQRLAVARRKALKAEGARRIEVALDRQTQLNLIAAAVSGDLSASELAMLRAS